MRWSRTGLLHSDRDFRRFWAGQSASVIGTQVTAVALPLVAVLSLNGGAATVSAVATASFLPNLFLPLLVGHWLEGRRKRRIMIWTDVIRAVVLLAVPTAYLTGGLSVPLLVTVALVVGSLSVVFEVAAFAHLPTLMPERQLGQANQAMQGSLTVAQVAGPGLSGALVQLLGPPLALLADVLSYIASIAGIAAVRRPEPTVEPDESRKRIVDGIRILVANRFLRALTGHASVYNCASQIFLVNLVIWAIQERGVSAGVYGFALSAGGVGALIGTLTALRLAGRLGYGRAFAASLVLSTGVPLLIATMPFDGTALGLSLAGVLLVASIGLGSANVLSVTLRQTVIPRNQLARTNGGYRLLMYGSIPIGAALGGVIGETLGSRAGVAIGTIGFAISALPMYARAVRRLRDPQDAGDRRPRPDPVTADPVTADPVTADPVTAEPITAG